MKVLAYTLPMTGHIFPVMSTLLELDHRGHDVVFVTGSRALDTVQRSGLTGRAATSAVDRELDDWKAATLRDALKRNSTLFADQAEPTAEDLERLIDEEAPDVLMIDPFAWGAMIAAEASGLPWVAASHSPMLIPVGGGGTRGTGRTAGRGARGRRLDRRVLAGSHRALDRGLQQLNAVRAARDLAPLGHVVDLMRRPPLTLAYTAEPFEYPRSDWHPSVRLVGPGLWEAPTEAPAWLGALDDRPLILVSSSSSYQADEGLVHTTLAALAGESVQVIATMPSGELPTRVPDNGRVTRYIPHSRLLPRAACLVCPGGLGTTQKALAYGVPVVVVPFGRDQHDVARRVQVAEAGVRLLPERLTPARLRDAVDEAAGCVEGAERIAEAFREAGGAAAAASEVEALGEDRRRQSAGSGSSAADDRAVIA